MKIWILLFAIFLSGAGLAGGIILDRKVLKEERWMMGRHPGQSIDKYSKELEITTDQKATIDSLRKEIDAKDNEIRALRDKLLNVLTPPQRTKYNEIVFKERGERTKAWIEKRVNAYKPLFGLTEAQVDSLRTAFQEAWDKRGELFKAGSRPHGDHQAMREMMDKIRKEQDDKVQATLTADQFEKYRLVESLNDFPPR